MSAGYFVLLFLASWSLAWLRDRVPVFSPAGIRELKSRLGRMGAAPASASGTEFPAVHIDATDHSTPDCWKWGLKIGVDAPDLLDRKVEFGVRVRASVPGARIREYGERWRQRLARAWAELTGNSGVDAPGEGAAAGAARRQVGHPFRLEIDFAAPGEGI